MEGSVTASALRNTAAVALLDAGIDLRDVQHLLGHAHVDSTAALARLSVRRREPALSTQLSRVDIVGRFTRRPA